MLAAIVRTAYTKSRQIFGKMTGKKKQIKMLTVGIQESHTSHIIMTAPVLKGHSMTTRKTDRLHIRTSKGDRRLLAKVSKASGWSLSEVIRRSIRMAAPTIIEKSAGLGA